MILFAAELCKQDQEHERIKDRPGHAQKPMGERGKFEEYCGAIRKFVWDAMECKGEKKIVEEAHVVKADVEAMNNTIAWLKVKVKDLERGV